MSGKTKAVVERELQQTKDLLRRAYEEKDNLWEQVCGEGHEWFGEVATLLGDEVERNLGSVTLHVQLTDVVMPGNSDGWNANDYEVVVKHKKTGKTFSVEYTEVDDVSNN